MRYIWEKDLYNLIDVVGENEQLEMTLFCLNYLMGWCEVFFNNEQEIKDYELLKQAKELLEKVKKSYKENY